MGQLGSLLASGLNIEFALGSQCALARKVRGADSSKSLGIILLFEFVNFHLLVLAVCRMVQLATSCVGLALYSRAIGSSQLMMTFEMSNKKRFRDCLRQSFSSQ